MQEEFCTFVLLLLIVSQGLAGCDSAPPAPPPRRDAGRIIADDAGRDASVMDAELGDGGHDGGEDAAAEDAAITIDAGIDADAGMPDAWAPCLTDVDADGDRPPECGGTDCDDTDPARSGIRDEVCGNLVDEDCSGTLDDLSDTVTCDLQRLCRNPDCFCVPGCSFALCVEQLRSGYVDFYHCANPQDLTDAYVMGCESVTACPDLISCVAGIPLDQPDLCMCAAGFPSCFGRCTDVQNDPYSCGSCGRACRTREVCEAGACVRCGGAGESCCLGPVSGACDSGLVCDFGSFICGP